MLDFGIAKAVSMTRSITFNQFGSIPYSSPERLQTGDMDARSDVWSVAIVLFEMLTGKPYFEARGFVEARVDDPELSSALSRPWPHCRRACARFSRVRSIPTSTAAFPARRRFNPHCTNGSDYGHAADGRIERSRCHAANGIRATPTNTLAGRTRACRSHERSRKKALGFAMPFVRLMAGVLIALFL